MLMVNSKTDGPTGRVDTLESTMQTALTPIEGRPATAAGPTPWRMGPGGLRLRSINATTQFGSAQEMDEELLGAWRREVGEGDTVVVLGDVAVPVLEGKRVELVAELPGWKVLVFGNHEQNGRGGVVTEPFDAAHLALAVAGDPPLVLTHMPSRRFPRAR